MSDLLVKLYNLPEHDSLLKKLEDSNICIRRAIAPEKHLVVDWVRKEFGPHWASECEDGFFESSGFMLYCSGKRKDNWLCLL